MKYFFYNDTIINVNQLIWIKQIADECIELVFENKITWYVCGDVERLFLTDIKLFLLSNVNQISNIFDVQKLSDAICVKKQEIEEEFSYFSQ